MNNVYITSDTHFGHGNIITYESRPFKNVEHMDQSLIKNWNNTVKKTDKIFHLGDVSFYNKEKITEIVSKLNGYKVLIKGNHDERPNQWWLDVGFNEVSSYPIIYKKNIIMSHEPLQHMEDLSQYFYLHGHVHGLSSVETMTENSCCVCVERWGYTPINLGTIIDINKINKE